MKSADVVKGTTYAVKVPIMRYGRRDGSEVRKLTAHGKDSTGKWIVNDGVNGTITVTPAAIIEPWADYELARAHEAALAEDRNRDREAERQIAYAAYAERVAGIAPAFDGIIVDKRALGTSSNTGDPLPVDLGEWIRSEYDAPGCSHGTITIDLLAAVAARLMAAQEAVLAAGGGWAGGGEPIIDGQREVIRLAPKASTALEALAEAAARAEHDEDQHGKV